MRQEVHIQLNGEGPGIDSEPTLVDLFYEAKKRSRRRLDRRELTNAEFLRMLLDVWELHEARDLCEVDDPSGKPVVVTDGGRSSNENRNTYVGTYKQRCRECNRRFTAAGSFCPYCGTPSEGEPVLPADDDLDQPIRTDGGIDRSTGATERFTNIECGHCGRWMKTDGSILWCPHSHGRGELEDGDIERVVEKLRRWSENGADTKQWDKGYNAALSVAADEIERCVGAETEEADRHD